MKSNHQFIIPFKGLKVGRHDFESEIDDTFFDYFPESGNKEREGFREYLPYQKGKYAEFEFELSGEIWVLCDRCLDEFLLPIEYHTKLFVKFGEETEEQTDEIILLSYGESEIDLTQYVYEFVHLSLPYRKIHPNDKKGKSMCNKEMLKKISEYSIRENIQDHNPEWDNLKDFLTNNN